MNREEILSKSRAEHKNKDIYELEIQKQAYFVAASSACHIHNLITVSVIL